jgi:hypothetical protein
VANNTIYPANARGLLQVVSEVEKNIDSESEGKFLLKQGGGLDASDREDLNHLEIYSWRWDNYKQRYPQYCQLAHEFRCERSYMARSQIGGLYKDWHPFGLSQREQRNPCDLTAQNFCSKSDWDEQRKELLSHFGSRAFFVRNHPLTEIGDRYLIEFGDPSNQVIPDIGFRAPVREAAQ